MFGFNTNSNRYKAIAEKAFVNANDLGDEVRHMMSRVMGIPEVSMDVIMTASNAATALFEYTALLYRIKLKEKIKNQYEFEKQDNLMIEAFADTLMIPAIAFHKIITNQDSPKVWENLLRQLPFPGIDVDHYLERANNIIDKAEV